jgi:putative tricarboxylic transport membrane protein
MPNRKRAEDRWSGFILGGIGGAICLAGVRLGVGSLRDPGSGFIFFCCGAILAGLSAVLIGGTYASQSGIDGKGPAQVRWLPALLICSGLLGYAWALERLGFLLSTFVLMSLLLRVTARARWDKAFVFGLAVTACSYGLFDVWLKARLPKGFLGF